MKKYKFLLSAAFLLLFASSLFAQESMTVSSGVGKGDTYRNAISVPVETIITLDCNPDMRWVYFTFDAPLNAMYYIQGFTGSYGPEFRLYNDKKKEIKKGVAISRELSVGAHTFEVKPYCTGSDFSFIITMYTWYTSRLPQRHETWTFEERQKEFLQATPIALSQNYDVKVVAKGQENLFRFTVTDTAKYQVSVISDDGDDDYELTYFDLFNEKCWTLTGGMSSTEVMLELFPGEYYLKTNSSVAPIGSIIHIIVAKEGEAGYDYTEASWMTKFQRSSPLLYVIFVFVVSMSICVLLYYAVYRPYSRFLKKNYGVRFFGVPFYIMLAAFLTVICLENFAHRTPGALEYTILIMCDIITTTWMVISQNRKNIKPLHIVANLLLVHVAYALTVIFMLFAVLLAMIILMLIIAAAVAMFVVSATIGGGIAGGIGAGLGGGFGGGGGGSSKCPVCGASKPAGRACPKCGDY